MSKKKPSSAEGTPEVAGAAICSAYTREILGEWPQESPALKRLRELAREYHERSERFDQLHCRARDKRGIAIPMTHEERKACTDNAYRLMKELGDEAERLGFTRGQWREAIRAADCMPNDGAMARAKKPLVNLRASRRLLNVQNLRAFSALPISDLLASPVYEDSHVKLYNCDARVLLPALDLRDAFCFTDPPYNVGKNYGTWNDSMTDEDYLAFCRQWMSEVKRCKAACLYVPAKWMMDYWQILGREWRQIVMTRNAAGAIRNGFQNYFASLLTNAKPVGKPRDWWHNVPCPGMGYFFREETFGHPGYTSEAVTNKVLAELCDASMVVDPFAGTGTTLYCAKMRGIKAVGCEVDAQHCKTIANRCSQAVLGMANSD